jgi:hypothetical protein
MGHAVLKNTENTPSPVRAFTLIQGGRFASVAARASIPSEIVALGLILALLQVFDGVLTAVGMSHFGTSMEGNLLLRSLMGVIGYIPALVLVKGASILLIGALCLQASKVRWLKSAFIGVIALYVVMAVIPWTYILLLEFLA